MALAEGSPTVPTPVPAKVKTSYSAARTWTWIALVVLLLAAAVVPPLLNINRYRRRVAQTISASIGRPVHMSAVKLRLLPRPAFELSEFVVEEDPAFGAEPMLRSPAVVASVRVASMWQGQLEIARIHFDEPSLNLVRNGSGEWNLGAVLLKASTAAPMPLVTSPLGNAALVRASGPSGHRSSAPRFPYIEASNARVNFKSGDEKKPFSFLNADLSVWLDGPDKWQVRFEAQPVRTDLDLDLADTGILKITGSFTSAAAIDQLPLDLHADWTRAPLGQLSRLLAGRDAGWRGDLEVRADISGTGNRALLKTQLRATRVHRIEFAPAEPMDMDANCEATYLRRTRSLEDLTCTSPVGNGHLVLHGAVHNMQHGPDATLDLEMEKVPVSAGLGLVRSVQQGFAPSLKAVGSMDGVFHYSGAESNSGAQLRGAATISGLELTAPSLDEPLRLPLLHLDAAEGPEARGSVRASRSLRFRGPGSRMRHASTRSRTHSRTHKLLHTREAAGQPSRFPEPALILRPFSLPAGGPVPLSVDGRFAASGYSMHFAGPASVESLVADSRALAMLNATVSSLAPAGTAELDLRTSGSWLTPGGDSDPSAAEPSVDGQLQLKNVSIVADYLAAPLHVLNAHGVFKGTEVAWDTASLNYGDLHADGSLEYPQSCSGSPECAAAFHLKFATLDLAAAPPTLLGGSGRTPFLGDLLARLDHRAHPWPTLNGTIEATNLTLGQLQAREATASLEISGNQVAIRALDGRILGGTLHLTGTLDASRGKPAYTVEASFAGLHAAELASMCHERWHEGWAGGEISGSTQLLLSGYKPEDLHASAKGTFEWQWIQDPTSLPALPSSAPRTEEPGGTASLASELPHFESWKAQGLVSAGGLSLTGGEMIPVHGPGAVFASATSHPGSFGLRSSSLRSSSLRGSNLPGSGPRDLGPDGSRPETSKIIRGTISFARELNLAVVASDAETRAQSLAESRIEETITGTLAQPLLHIDSAAVPPSDLPSSEARQR